MRGFTLLELFIVVSITLVLVLAAVPVYSNLMVKSQLKESSAQLVMNLRDARGNAVSGFRASAHGIFVDIDHNIYIAYVGDSYVQRNPAFDRINMLETAISVVNIDMIMSAGGLDINFSKGFGRPSNVGSFKLVHSVEGVVQIKINSLGNIEEN